MQLREDDFVFDGPLGSRGAAVAAIGPGRFRIALGKAPDPHPDANVMQCAIARHARGVPLCLEVACDKMGAGGYPFNDSFCSWSYDRRNWTPAHWQPEVKTPDRATLYFPAFERDTVYIGHQAPMTVEDLEALLRGWARHPAATLHAIGKSVEGRPLYRLAITAPAGSSKKPAHYFIQQHPCEHNAQWRMAGMIDWLLSAEAREFRKQHVCHFVLTQCPDGVVNGWKRCNAEGIDLWRSFRVAGPDRAQQGHEAYLGQLDFERLMQAAPLASVWAMHTWQGPVENFIIPGRQLQKTPAAWEALRDSTLALDRRGLCRPLKPWVIAAGEKYQTWCTGVWKRFGITVFLSEGAGGLHTQQANLESGRIMIQGLAGYYGRGGVL